MLKQTIIWTALPHGTDGAFAAGTKLRLSAFVAPRLWSDDPNVKTLQLADFPDFLDWPATVGAATYEVDFGGGVKLPATMDPSQALHSNMWKALFKTDTLVIPFAFRDHTGAVLETFSAVDVHTIIQRIYTHFGTDPSLGNGADMPPRHVAGTHPELIDIARPVDPPKRFEPTPIGPTSTFVGTHGPEEDVPQPNAKPPETEPEGGQGCLGCGGCLTLPIALLRRFFKWIGLIALLPFTMGSMGGSRSRETRAPNGAGSSAGGGAATPMTANRASIEALQAYVKPFSEESTPMPSPDDLTKTYDFHQMVSMLGDYPNLLRYLGLVIDLEVTLAAALPPPSGTVKVTPTLPLAMTTANHTPRTHYSLADQRFLTRGQAGGDVQEGLLRVDDSGRFQVIQEDVAGGGIKLQSAATTITNGETNNSTTPLDPEEEGLPSLQTAGLSLVRIEQAKELSASFLASKALNNALAAIDGSPNPPAAGGPEPPPKDELFAEDVVRGYRVDVFDDKSKKWHSLCRRVGDYDFGDVTINRTAEEDEGFMQLSVTEAVKETKTKVLRVHDSLFTWNGWSLAAPRYGNTILPKPDAAGKTQLGAPPNEPATQFKLKATFTPKKGSLPRLRFGYSYRLRVRAVDLAGNSVFDPTDDAAFQATQTAVTPEETYRRFEPIAPPMLMLQTTPVEGESLERLVVRSQFDDAPALIRAQETTRHLVPPKTSQLMAEQHRKYDAAPGMKSDLATYQAASREAGSLLKFIDPLTGDEKDIPGASVDAQKHAVQINPSFDLSYLPDPYARGVLLMGLPGMAPGAIVDTGTDGINKIAFEGNWPELKPMRLRVTGIEDGAVPKPPHWDAAQRVLSVEVPQGETFPVRISSWLKVTDLENMAVWNWIAASGVPNLSELHNLSVGGRNWLVLPYRTLVLVHAVQQPLRIPVVKSVKADKKLGATLATLTGDVNVEPKSTEKIDLQADWTDPVDDLSKKKFELVPHTMHVGELKAGLNSDLVPLDGIPHPIGDTKYHSVRYSTVATTRFREYFPVPVPPAPELILVRPTGTEVVPPSVMKTVDVPNSGRPAAPKPLYIVPTFLWKRSASGLEVSRRGGGLRVYMERPWYSSGDGELLGVALRPAGVPLGSPAAERLKKYTSEWGMDPLWPATPTAPLSKFNFLAFSEDTSAPVSLAELDGDKVDVVGFTPAYDEERQLWYCDILLEPDQAYFPMIKLALVRFQPISVDGAHISPVVPTDFIQVVPHREIKYDVANVDSPGGTVGIEVRGPAFATSQANSGPQMIVRIEERSNDADGILGWKPVKAELIPLTTKDPKGLVWKTAVALPAARPKPMRVIVLEAELLQSDGRGAVDPLKVFAGTGLPGLEGPIVIGLAEREITVNAGYRVTFADALEVT